MYVGTFFWVKPRSCFMFFFYIAECENGFYDSICNSTCGHCLNYENCDKSNGHCSHGCQLHYQPPLCQGSSLLLLINDGLKCNNWRHNICSKLVCFFTLVCENGYYGGSCENKCGYCLNAEQCDKQNGTCITGCQPHFLYPLCKGNLIYM